MIGLERKEEIFRFVFANADTRASDAQVDLLCSLAGFSDLPLCKVGFRDNDNGALWLLFDKPFCGCITVYRDLTVHLKGPLEMVGSVAAVEKPSAIETPVQLRWWSSETANPLQRTLQILGKDEWGNKVWSDIPLQLGGDPWKVD